MSLDNNDNLSYTYLCQLQNILQPQATTIYQTDDDEVIDFSNSQQENLQPINTNEDVFFVNYLSNPQTNNEPSNFDFEQFDFMKFIG